MIDALLGFRDDFAVDGAERLVEMSRSSKSRAALTLKMREKVIKTSFLDLEDCALILNVTENTIVPFPRVCFTTKSKKF